MGDSVDEHLQQSCFNDTAAKARGALTQLKYSHFQLCVHPVPQLSTSALAERAEAFTAAWLLFGRDKGAHKGL